ncbi:MAG: hypothetical protein U0414_22045 [Polyangiaceae bacterium]
MRGTLLSSLGVVALSVGCTAGGGLGAGGAGGGGPGGSGDSASSGFSGGTGMSTGSSMNNGCAEAATLVYVLSAQNDLYSFQPDKKTFTKIGPLGCQTGMQPNSMAVDRDAVAWVNYVDNDGFEDTAGAVFKVSTADASCTATSIKLDPEWYRLGMGFASDDVGGTTEKLFVTGTGGISNPGLGRIDFGTQKVVPIGPFTGGLDGESAELTGTGDARLFGFFTTTPVRVAQIDPGSGAISNNKPLASVPTPLAWAFSFWGGDFYLYTSPDGVSDSTVTRYRPSDGTTDTSYMTQIGFTIVGAGVSTCAPTTPPK